MLIHLSLFCFGVTAGILIQFFLVTLPALRTVTRWQNLAASSLKVAEDVLKYTEQFTGFHPAEFGGPLLVGGGYWDGDDEPDEEDSSDEEDWDDADVESTVDELPDTMEEAQYPLHKEKPPEEDIDTLI